MSFFILFGNIAIACILKKSQLCGHVLIDWWVNLVYLLIIKLYFKSYLPRFQPVFLLLTGCFNGLLVLPARWSTTIQSTSKVGGEATEETIGQKPLPSCPLISQRGFRVHGLITHPEPCHCSCETMSFLLEWLWELITKYSVVVVK